MFYGSMTKNSRWVSSYFQNQFSITKIDRIFSKKNQKTFKNVNLEDHFLLKTFFSIFQVLDVLRVDDKKFSLSLSLYFGVVWKEHRLHLPPPGSNNSGASWLPIDLEFMSNLWVRIFIFSNFYCMLPNPNDSFSNLNSDCSNILDMRNLRKQVKKAFCYQKLLWPFTVGINCSSGLKNFENSLPSASNFQSFSRSLEQFFVTVGQSNFGNKIPFFHSRPEQCSKQNNYHC